jgi:hypothetical protein
MSGSLLTHTPDRNCVTAVAAGQEPRNPPDCRDADTGQAMDLPVGQPTLQELYDAPPIRHCLNLGWCTKIAQKRAAFLGRLQGGQGRVQIAFSEGFLPGGHVSMVFHGVPM